jgi:hypothetical protein
VTTADLTLTDPMSLVSTVRVRLAAGAGWDVRIERGMAGELTAHYEDWHRLERSMARMGLHVLSIDTDLDAV